MILVLGKPNLPAQRHILVCVCALVTQEDSRLIIPLFAEYFNYFANKHVAKFDQVRPVKAIKAQ